MIITAQSHHHLPNESLIPFATTRKTSIQIIAKGVGLQISRSYHPSPSTLFTPVFIPHSNTKRLQDDDHYPIGSHFVSTFLPQDFFVESLRPCSENSLVNVSGPHIHFLGPSRLRSDNADQADRRPKEE
jgi:hypothetical protein